MQTDVDFTWSCATEGAEQGATFKQAAIDRHRAMKAGWRNRHHSDSWRASLENHVYDRFGSRPVDAIPKEAVDKALAHRIPDRVGATRDVHQSKSRR